ncbi:TonB-dependent receptor plug domain-containing protein [Aquabacter spiritensis]|uniref:Vitamin B12 transporter n=1 Tax=Aquabacter spiritensis TaxID=933073 RepID=A0A4R3LUZ7_9HYPH|nr:TonB-dependent receptor [Aquabacter spiritensis]TCT04373.1 vitamin B12 transporter [Aquabacter spiritensis]
MPTVSACLVPGAARAAGLPAPTASLPAPLRASLRASRLATLLATPLVCISAAALAQTADTAQSIDLPEMVVSATGIPTPADRIASSVSVVTAEEIDRQQLRTLPQVLQTLPGLNVVQTGGPGGQTSVFIRGTNSNHVKVLIDGIDAGNPSTPNGAFDFGQLLATDLARVEVLRGPQSGLYGSDAIGGVISVTTKKGEGPPKVFGFVEGGALGTFNQAAAVSGATEQLAYSFNVTHFSSTDIPVTPPNIVPPGSPIHPNSYDNWTYSTRLDLQMTDALAFNFVARYIDSQLAFTPDIYPPPFYSGIPAPQRSTSGASLFFTKGEGVWTALDGRLATTFGVSAMNTSNPTTGPNSGVNGQYDGDRQVYYLRSNFAVAAGQTLLAGIERRDESMTSSTAYTDLSANTGDTGVYGEWQGTFDRVFYAANVRYDSDDTFGDHTTFRLAPGLRIPETGTTLRGSIGTGFKAPSLYQLYAPYYGNADLKPEESTGYDIGFAQEVFGGRVTFGATYFHNDITNLISYDPVTYANVNISSATTQGAETFLAVAVTERLKLRLDYTYTYVVGYMPPGEPFGAACAPLTPTSCTPLRRPNTKVSVTADWNPTDALTLSASLIYASSWWDIVRLSSETIDQPGYTVVNLAANYALGPAATLFGRIDNLFDQTYENPNGFLAPGFGAYGGIKFTY